MNHYFTLMDHVSLENYNAILPVAISPWHSDMQIIKSEVKEMGHYRPLYPFGIPRNFAATLIRVVLTAKQTVMALLRC